MLNSIFHLDIVQFVSIIGYIGIFAIVFLETGLFFGFFFPGDSLVFAAGLLAAKGIFNIWILVPTLIVLAILGYTVGYWFGDKLGIWLLKKEDSFFYKRRYLDKAHLFYKRHGGKSLVLGRLIPIVRTFIPIVAGMVKMPFKKYSFYNVVGGVIWGGGVTLAGYYLGALFPQVIHYLLPIVIIIVILSVLPAIYHLIKERQDQKN